MPIDHNNHNNTYNEEYCSMLEAAYGLNMLSEGGESAIDDMFTGINLNHAIICDIGCGLGGVDIYLASKHRCNITGLDIPNSVIEAAKTRLAESDHVGSINYKQFTPPVLPFENDSLDIVFSKGALVHEENKQPLFDDVFRVLKPNGILLINDWLSPQSQWGTSIQQLSELEDLVLHP